MVFPPSPDITKSAILGASSAGWSPQRSTRRVMNSSAAQSPSDYGDSEHGSPSRVAVPEHRAKLGALRSHGLVSNSVFKGSSNNPSPSSSPSRRQFGSPSSPSRMGLGLGISAATAAAETSAAVPRSMSAASMDSYGTCSDAENEDQSTRFSSQSGSPRKSKNFRRLENANYVSNSPFRRTENGSDQSPQRLETTPPLQLPNNAWARSAAAAQALRSTASTAATVGRPRTPETTPQRTATAIEQGQIDLGTPTHNTTPRGGLRKVAAANAGVDSPSSVRGLLVSNRLHGPRLMDDSNVGSGSVTNSPHDSPTKRERRKTVTFDEILDVQEFDRESSYDRDSLQSGSSEASSLNGAAGNVGGGLGSREASSDDEVMWLQSRQNEDARMSHGAQKVVERLMVVNASPDSHSSAFSTPELMGEGPNRANVHAHGHMQHDDHDDANLGAYDASSNDSREVSSVDEPQSPPPEELSMSHNDDKSFASNGEATIYHDGTYTAEGESDVSGGNLSAYGALHRVESMVDELLEDELLDGRIGQRRQQQDHEQQPVMDSPPRRRGGRVAAAPGRPISMQSPGPVPSALAQPADLTLNLPAWSPFMQTAPSPVVNNAATIAAAQGRPTGRPHISRDAVLQRVAREKQLMEEQHRQEQRSDVDGAAAGDRSEVVSRTRPQEAATSTGIPRRSSPEHNRSPVRSANAEPTQMAAAQVPVGTASPSRAQGSPLDRLSAQVTAEQQHRLEAMTDEAHSASADSAANRQRSWFGGSSREGSAEPEVVPMSAPGLTPAQQAEQIIARRRSKNGHSQVIIKPAHQAESEVAQLEQSESTESIEAPQQAPVRQSLLLDASTLKTSATEQDGFESGLQRELSRIYRHTDAKYKVKDRGVYTHDDNASSPEKEVQKEAASANGQANAGKAWRKLRRPSDMNEYAQEMRDYRAKENPKRVAGKVFVLVDSFTPTNLPVPAASRPTRFYCVLDNGLHVVRTATAGLRTSGTSKIGQEFELVQHRNLAFSLTLVAQRDAHLREPKYEQAQHGSPSGSSALSSSPSKRITPSFSRGVGKLFSSPKKRGAGGLFGSSGTSTSSLSSEVATTVEPMVSFMNNDGAFGQCQVVFDKIANASLLQCHTIDMPMYGVKDTTAVAAATATPLPSMPQRSPMSSAAFSRNLNTLRGTLRLKVFYLPPLPGVAKTLLPDSLSDCIKGMEAARWHAKQQQQMPWMQGTLTQLGGDCQSWRRRPVKAQGVHLIGYNEITKKPVVKIDLSKALSVEPNHDPVKQALDSRAGTVVDNDDEAADETYHVERSFRITFKDGERIFYFADSDEEMQSWITALAKVIGNAQVPPQCVWAQMALDVVLKSGTTSATTTTTTSKTAETAPSVDTKASQNGQNAHRPSAGQRVPIQTVAEE